MICSVPFQFSRLIGFIGIKIIVKFCLKKLLGHVFHLSGPLPSGFSPKDFPTRKSNGALPPPWGPRFSLMLNTAQLQTHCVMLPRKLRPALNIYFQIDK